MYWFALQTSLNELTTSYDPMRIHKEPTAMTLDVMTLHVPDFDPILHELEGKQDPLSQERHDHRLLAFPV